MSGLGSRKKALANLPSKPDEALLLLARRLADGEKIEHELLLSYSPLALQQALDQELRLRESLEHKSSMIKNIREKAMKGDMQAARLWHEIVDGRKPLVAIQNNIQTTVGDAADRLRAAGVTIDVDSRSVNP